MPELTPESIVVDSVLQEGLRRGSFGKTLNDLTFEQLKKLKEKLDEHRKKANEGISSWDKIRANVNRTLGSQLFPLEHLKKKRNLYEGLYKELNIIGKSFEMEQFEKKSVYARQLVDKIHTLDPVKKQNLTDWHLDKLMRVEAEAQMPDESGDGKVVVSYNAPVEESVAFLKEHMPRAIILDNERQKH